MRHIYIRGIIALIWLAAAIVCGVSGNFPMMGLYLVLAGVFLYSAYAAWKKEKDEEGKVMRSISINTSRRLAGEPKGRGHYIGKGGR